MKTLTMALLLCATFSVNVDAAQAEPCAKQISQLEAVIRQSPMGASAGPTAPETIGAKLGHQPTTASVEIAASRAQSRFASLVAKAKALDAQGEDTACMRALTDAQQSFELQ
jgi:hypothetical protein